MKFFSGVNLKKTINMIVSNYKPVTGKHFPSDKHPGINPDILFYKVDDNNNSNTAEES